MSGFQTVLPKRNCRIPEQKQRSNRADSEFQNDIETPSESEEEEEEIVSVSVSKDSEGITRNNTWKIPKAHTMMHTAQTILLYGLLMASSAEVIEKRHCAIKKLATKNSQT